jgi:hypothetical protein
MRLFNIDCSKYYILNIASIFFFERQSTSQIVKSLHPIDSLNASLIQQTIIKKHTISNGMTFCLLTEMETVLL